MSARCARTIAKLAAGEHVTMVALGDSNTERTFHTQGRLNWVGLLAEAIFETYGNGVCTLINAGKCGSSYTESLTRLDRDVLRFTPDCVILALGMNDATQGEAGLPAFQEAVRTTVWRIRESTAAEILIRTSNPVITVHGLPLPAGHGPGEPWRDSRRPLARYCATLVELARELDCPVVDHYSLWATREFAPQHPVADPTGLWPRMADAIHPGALGHMVFFRELAASFDVPPSFPWEGNHA